MTRARQSGRTLLTEVEAKQLAGRLWHPNGRDTSGHQRNRGRQHAEDIGYPVVLKLFSETITHKSDVGGVQLHLTGADAVRHRLPGD